MNNLLTTNFDQQEFKLNTPVITNISYEYDNENRAIRSETNVNAILIGGGEETRVSEFFYDETGGFRTVSRSSNEDKETESIIAHDEQNRISRIETPITITEYEYRDGEYTITIKDKIKETITDEIYADIDGKDRLVSKVISTATGDKIFEEYHEYSLENDTMTLSIYNHNGNDTYNVYKYSTGQLIETHNGFIGNYSDAHLKYEYDENNILSKIYVFTKVINRVKETIEYKIEKIDENTYITKSDYDSIVVTKDDHLDYVDRVVFNPIGSNEDFHNQRIKLDNYELESNIDIAINNNGGDSGKCEMLTIDSDNDHIYQLKIIDNEGNIVLKLYLLDFKYEGKRYFIDTQYEPSLTKASVTNYTNFDAELETEEIVFKTDENNAELLNYIISKLKLYIESNENLKEILNMSKISLDI